VLDNFDAVLVNQSRQAKNTDPRSCAIDTSR